MKRDFNPRDNYEKTKKTVGYRPLHKATQADYDRVGFKAGLNRKKAFLQLPG